MGQDIKKAIIIIVLIIIAAGAAYVVYPYINSLNGDSVLKKIILHETSNDPSPFYIQDKGVKLAVSIADSELEREEGLSGVQFQGDTEGKLFVFDEPGYYQMWMKDMLFSLDIIWLDSNFNIVTIKKNVDPSTYPESFGPTEKAQFVLEINEGLADKYGFAVGDKFTPVDTSNDF